MAEREPFGIKAEIDSLQLHDKSLIDTHKRATLESCDLKDEAEESPGLQAAEEEAEMRKKITIQLSTKWTHTIVICYHRKKIFFRTSEAQNLTEHYEENQRYEDGVIQDWKEILNCNHSWYPSWTTV